MKQECGIQLTPQQQAYPSKGITYNANFYKHFYYELSCAQRNLLLRQALHVQLVDPRHVIVPQIVWIMSQVTAVNALEGFTEMVVYAFKMVRPLKY